MKHSFFAPRQVRQLNTNLVRSQAYPSAPWVTAQGVQQYRDQTQPMAYMPQAMAFGKYKTPPAGYAQGQMGESAANVVMLGMAFTQREARLVNAATQGVPFGQMREVAEPLNQLPAPQTSMNMNPWSRGVLERSSVQPSTNLMAAAADIASDPVTYARNNYMMPRVGPPRMPDVYRVRRFPTKTGY